MSSIEPSEINCPYCGEKIEIAVDCSVQSQECIEDCSVCCWPIHLRVEVDEAGGVKGSMPAVRMNKMPVENCRKADRGIPPN